LKADPKPPGPRKLNYTGHFGWQEGKAEQQKRDKMQKTSKGISPACVLPTAIAVPPVNLPKEEPAPAVKKEEPHGLGLTWESF
jgi:hypothetical protein